MLNILGLGLFLLSVGLWLRWRRKKFTFFKKLGIQGPEPSIFFGNLIEMLRKGPTDCQAEWVKKYGGVLGYYYGSWPVLLVSDPELMKQVLIKDFNLFADRPDDLHAVFGDNPSDPRSQNMINLKGKRWKEVRAMLSPVFTSGKLKQMLPMMNDSASIMLSKLESASKNGTADVEIFSLYQGLTMDVIGRSAFGIESSVQNNPSHPLLCNSKLLLSSNFKSPLLILILSFREFFVILNFIRRAFLFVIAKGKDPLDEVFRICREVIQKRRTNPASRRVDLLQTVIDARSSGEEISEKSLVASSEDRIAEEKKAYQVNEGVPVKNLKRLTDEEVIANAVVYFTAGYETTSTALAFLTHHLVNNPDVQELVREEIFDTVGSDGPISYEHLGLLHYTDRVIMESLRMHPPVYNFENRDSTSEVQLGKWRIPPETTVQIPVWALHYDPTNFEDPHTFNPNRFLPENRNKNHNVIWQPFGAGPRNCIAMRFALMEIKLTLMKLLRKYRFKPSEKTELGNLKISPKLVVLHPASGIHLRAVPL